MGTVRANEFDVPTAIPTNVALQISRAIEFSARDFIDHLNAKAAGWTKKWAASVAAGQTIRHHAEFKSTLRAELIRLELSRQDPRMAPGRLRQDRAVRAADP